MHILLFGGSFNPPHLGHLIVIKQAFELIPSIDELWILPTSTNPIVDKAEISPEQKKALCELFVADVNHPQVKLSTFELDNPSNGSTYATLQKLKEAFPQQTFSFLMGSDQLPIFTKWNQWKALLNEMVFYVYPRSGYPMNPLLPGMIALNDKNQVITNISSTLIRNRRQKNLPISHLLTPSISDYVS